MFRSNNPALVIIDCQEAIDSFDSSLRSNLDAELRIQKLLLGWRARNRPIFHVRHSSRDINSPYHASKSTFKFKKLVAPLEAEPVITKRENSAFIGTDLEARLKKIDVTELVI